MNDTTRTAEYITKFVITFHDGSVKTMVGQDRFLKVRDAGIAMTNANNSLVRQNQHLSERIEELQKLCFKLEAEVQAGIDDIFGTTPPSPTFHNPLP